MSSYSSFILYTLINVCFLPILINSSLFYLDPSAFISEEKGTIDNPYITFSKLFKDSASNEESVSIYIMNDLNESFDKPIIVQNHIEIIGYRQKEKSIDSESLRFLIDGGRLEFNYVLIRSKDFSFDVLGNGSVTLKVNIFLKFFFILLTIFIFILLY